MRAHLEVVIEYDQNKINDQCLRQKYLYLYVSIYFLFFQHTSTMNWSDKDYFVYKNKTIYCQQQAFWTNEPLIPLYVILAENVVQQKSFSSVGRMHNFIRNSMLMDLLGELAFSYICSYDSEFKITDICVYKHIY